MCDTLCSLTTLDIDTVVYLQLIQIVSRCLKKIKGYKICLHPWLEIVPPPPKKLNCFLQFD